MDKYTGYVIVVYLVTLLLLGAYLGWIWWRMRALREDHELHRDLQD